MLEAYHCREIDKEIEEAKDELRRLEEERAQIMAMVATEKQVQIDAAVVEVQAFDGTQAVFSDGHKTCINHISDYNGRAFVCHCSCPEWMIEPKFDCRHCKPTMRAHYDQVNAKKELATTAVKLFSYDENRSR
jgi:hypothetical protein